MKLCGKCGVNKGFEFFNKDSRSKSGLQVNCKSCQKEYYIANKSRYQELKKTDRYKGKMREYQVLNSDKINKYKRDRYKSEEGNVKVRACNSQRRAVKRTTSDGSVTHRFILNLLKNQGYKCAISGRSIKEGYHIDHIIPLSKGGTHTSDNIQLLLPSINMSKKDKIDYKL